MSDDHHGRRTEEATLLARAADEILGTHRPSARRLINLTARRAPLCLLHGRVTGHEHRGVIGASWRHRC
jgi:hypothetical protein